MQFHPNDLVASRKSTLSGPLRSLRDNHRFVKEHLLPPVAPFSAARDRHLSACAQPSSLPDVPSPFIQ